MAGTAGKPGTPIRSQAGASRRLAAPSAARCQRAGVPATLEHAYFEIVYAPLVGPTAVLLARAMARHLDIAGGPTTVCPVELALEVGIRASSTDPLGRKSHLVHAIGRLAHDRIVSRLGDRVLGVRAAVPALSARTLERLPATARHAHAQYVLVVRDRRDP